MSVKTEPLRYDNCKECVSRCVHAGKDREFVYRGDKSCKIVKKQTRLNRSEWEPCEQCRNGNTIIDIPVCDEFRLAYKGKSNEQTHFLFRFQFCPHCGRPLTDAAWDTLERRLAGREHQ